MGNRDKNSPKVPMIFKYNTKTNKLTNSAYFSYYFATITKKNIGSYYFIFSIFGYLDVKLSSTQYFHYLNNNVHKHNNKMYLNIVKK